MMKNTYFPKWLIAEYLDTINKAMFGSALPLSDLIVKQSRKESDAMAFYTDYDILIFTIHHPTTEELFLTLAHELVHYYQDILELPKNHNGKFFKHYAKKCENIFGYDAKTF